MKISVITPSYNQGHFIKETIDSVLDQEIPELEFIVMDGGSNDDTIQVLESYGNKITWKSEKDRGQTHAINKGLELATGDIICYLNSDDYFLPDTLIKVIKAFEEPGVKWVSGDYVIVDENGKEIQSFVASYKRLLKLFPQKFMLGIANYIVQPATFWRKEIVDEFGPFDEDLHLTMDYDYWMRIISKYPLKIIKEPLCAFRIHGDSKGGTIFEKQFNEEYETAKKHGVGAFSLFIHKLHNWFIVKSYKILK